jgi:hypothetical protein
MIVDKNIEIKISSKNLEYYKNKLDNNNLNVNDIILIKPNDLPETSKTKINVKCDICNNVKSITIYSYRRNISKYNFYACSQKCAYLKNKKTNLERYGKEFYTQTDNYILKSRNTKKEKYNDENYINKEKMKDTCLFKYGVDSYMKTDEFKEKSKKTNLEKYGVEYPLQSRIILNKMINTNNDKYGVDFVFQNDNIKNKIKKSKKIKYDDYYFNNREKYKETCIKLFGVDNPMKNEKIFNKLINIIYDKYGVYYVSQLPYFFEKMLKSGYKIKKYKNTDIYYQGTYEKDFLDNYYDKINIKRAKKIKYIFDNKEHIYYPDFYIEELNLIIEIKSSKWYYEHKDKNIEKEKACKNQKYNYLLIIDKNYTVFDKLIKHLTYNKEHSWQYDIRLNKKNNFDIDNNIKVTDFKFEYIDSKNPITKDIVNFIKEYEWLGKMPNRPTHRFISTYNGKIGGVIIMSTPNSFSKILGENTKDIEKLISRGACASWTPKNLASSLLMFSIKWMVENTKFRLFSAYADPEAKELGTIYQACNFKYIGNNYGSDKLYFDEKNYHLGWTTSRNFTKLNFYKSYLNKNNIKWDESWNIKTKILWDKIPNDIVNMMKSYTKERIDNCIVRKSKSKHKYIYILGKDKRETKYLNKKFEQYNPNLINLKYPKDR